MSSVQRPRSGDDERFLAGPEAAPAAVEDRERLLRIAAEFASGFSALAEVGPAVSIFGSIDDLLETISVEFLRAEVSGRREALIAYRRDHRWD